MEGVENLTKIERCFEMFDENEKELIIIDKCIRVAKDNETDHKLLEEYQKTYLKLEIS